MSIVTRREWTTDFSDGVPSWLSLSNFTLTTDSGTPAIQATTPANQSFAQLTAGGLRNVDIELVFRLQAAGGFTLPNTTAFVFGRYQDASNFWALSKNFDPAVKYLYVQEKVAGADHFNAPSAVGSGDSVVNVTDYRHIRLRVIEDACQAKEWFTGSTEPDWKFTVRMFPPNTSLSGGSTSVDNIDFGSAAFSFQFTSSFVSNLTIRELVRDDA